MKKVDLVGIKRQKDFKSQEEAISYMNSQNTGEKKKSDLIAHIFQSQSEEENERIRSFDLYFSSENNKGFYTYIIEKHSTFFRLKTYSNSKNKMITAAQQGDLKSFMKNFIATEKMVGFSLTESIRTNNWNIVKYIISLDLSFEVKDYKGEIHLVEINKKAVSVAIRWNQVEILKELMGLGYYPRNDWLAYCMYNDSFEVARELLENQQYHLSYQKSELQTEWYKKEIIKDKKTSKLVKSIIESGFYDKLF